MGRQLHTHTHANLQATGQGQHGQSSWPTSGEDLTLSLHFIISFQQLHENVSVSCISKLNSLSLLLPFTIPGDVTFRLVAYVTKWSIRVNDLIRVRVEIINSKSHFIISYSEFWYC